jgi:hypothetical protein
MEFRRWPIRYILKIWYALGINALVHVRQENLGTDQLRSKKAGARVALASGGTSTRKPLRCHGLAGKGG